MKIFLVRHGESKQNTLENYDNFPDFKVLLTENGKQQAEECGTFLAEYCLQNKIDLSDAKMFVSPFARTRETADIINSHLNIKNIEENPLLVERQYGLFDNLAYEDRANYPISYKFGKWMDEHDGRFYKKMPLGESPLDVYVRAKLFLEDLKRDIEKGIENIVIVSHGLFLKVFQMAYFNYSVEWFNSTGYMKNCSVQLIEKIDDEDFDRKYIFKDEFRYQ